MISTQRRHLFAFHNGIYNAATDRFHIVDDVCTRPAPLASDVKNVGSDDGIHYDRYTPVAQRFDEPFAVAADVAWYELRDPIVDTLLDAQQIGGESRWHLWAALGRLLYDVNELDQWERTLVVTGPSPCGIGVLARRVGALYASDHVLTCPSLAPDPDQTLGRHAQALLVIEDVGLERAAHHRGTLPAEWFVRMTSGATLPTHARTAASDTWNLDHLSISSSEAMPLYQWRAPMLYVANALAPWMHKRHVLRRLFCVPFAQRISNVDPHLLRDACYAMATFVVKANRAYRALVLHQRRHHADQCPFSQVCVQNEQDE